MLIEGLPSESKASVAVRSLAAALLRMPAGQHIARIGDLAPEVGVGAGTLHKAFHVLVDEGVVRATRVQRYGTTIEWLDYPRLWTLTGRNVVRGILPMPLSASLEGLAAAVTEALRRLGLEAALVYREGAAARVAAVEEGHADFAVLSRLALDRLDRLDPVHEFGAGSYYGDTGIFRLHREKQRPMRRVGADADSPDHRSLVRAEFPDAEMVSAPFRRIPGLIAAGRIDASVWYGGTAIPVRYVDRLTIRPARSDHAGTLSQTAAVIATGRDGFAGALLRMLDGDVLRDVYDTVSADDLLEEE